MRPSTNPDQLGLFGPTASEAPPVAPCEAIAEAPRRDQPTEPAPLEHEHQDDGDRCTASNRGRCVLRAGHWAREHTTHRYEGDEAPEPLELVAQPTPTHAEAAALDVEDQDHEHEPPAIPEPAELCGAGIWAWGHRYACALPYGHEDVHSCTRHLDPCDTCDEERAAAANRAPTDLFDTTAGTYEPPDPDRGTLYKWRGWHEAITWPDPNADADPHGFTQPIARDANGHGATIENRDTRTDWCDEREHPTCPERASTTGRVPSYEHRADPCPDDPASRYDYRGACPCGWRGPAREREGCAYLDAAAHAWPEWWTRAPRLPDKYPKHDAPTKRQAEYVARVREAIPADWPDASTGAPILDDLADHRGHRARADHAAAYFVTVGTDRLAHYTAERCPFCDPETVPCAECGEPMEARPPGWRSLYHEDTTSRADRCDECNHVARAADKATRAPGLREAIADDPDEDEDQDDGQEGWCPVCEDDHEPPFCDELEGAEL